MNKLRILIFCLVLLIPSIGFAHGNHYVHHTRSNIYFNYPIMPYPMYRLPPPTYWTPYGYSQPFYFYVPRYVYPSYSSHPYFLR